MAPETAQKRTYSRDGNWTGALCLCDLIRQPVRLRLQGFLRSLFSSTDIEIKSARTCSEASPACTPAFYAPEIELDRKRRRRVTVNALFHLDRSAYHSATSRIIKPFNVVSGLLTLSRPVQPLRSRSASRVECVLCRTLSYAFQLLIQIQRARCNEV